MGPFDLSDVLHADNYVTSLRAQLDEISALPPQLRAYLANDLRRADDRLDSRPWCEHDDCQHDATGVRTDRNGQPQGVCDDHRSGS